MSVSISNKSAEVLTEIQTLILKRFLYFNLASNSKVRSMLFMVIRLGFNSEKTTKELITNSIEISKMLFGLIKSLK